MDQFVTRFLLRETVSQLQALQSSLEGASDTLEAQARGQRYVRGLLARGLVCVCVPFVPAFQTPQCHGLPNLLGQGGHELVRRDRQFRDWDSNTQEICLAPPKLGPVLESWS